MGETIFAYLAEAGIRCRIVQLEYGAWINVGRRFVRPTMDGIMSTMWGQGLPGDPTDAWSGHVHTAGDGWGTYSYESTPELDVLIETLRTTMDVDTRVALIKQIARLKHELVAGGLPTYRPMITLAWRDKDRLRAMARGVLAVDARHAERTTLKGYILRRLMQGVVAIVGALLIVFVAQRLSGDPVALMLPMDAGEGRVRRHARGPRARPAAAVAVRRVHRQCARGRLRAVLPVAGAGHAAAARQVAGDVGVGIGGLVFALLLAVPLGVVSAVHRGGMVDRVAKLFAMLGQAVPGFWIGLLLILFVAVQLQWLPAFGRGGVANLCCRRSP